MLAGLCGASLALAGRVACADPQADMPNGTPDETLAPPPQSGLTLMVSGPPDGAPGRLADLIAPLIAPHLLGASEQAGRVLPAAGRTRLSLETTGGTDGVTAANAFEARAAADGSAALVVPGTAALAWLAGDPRVHFDAGSWVPALATVAPAVLVGRMPARGLRPGGRLVIGAASPAGRELPALLGLALLGIEAEAVFGLAVEQDLLAALHGGRIDAMLLAGSDVPERLGRLAAIGAGPLFALGTTDGSRDPELPAVATLDELALRETGHRPVGPLAPAFRASAAATRLDAAVVLPPLAPADVVARWRAACDDASNSLPLRSATAEQAIRPIPAPECVAAVSAVVAGETALLDLHRFLADRYGWRPA